MAKESYNDLIFQLGDLAREQLVNKPDRPKPMDRVLRAEDVVVQRRDELAELEAQMNDLDVAHQESLDAIADERAQQQEIVKKFKRAVVAIEGRVKDMRKKLATSKADVRYNKDAVKKAELRHADLEMTSDDQMKVDLSKQNLKKMRLAVMRQDRGLEEQAYDLDQVLTPKPGQPGAPGILAHKRLLELEDEVEALEYNHRQEMDALDRVIAAKEQEVQAAEDFLDQALFLLGEDCYAQRIHDAALAALYPRIDKAK
jgi:hypothetical protein